ncbi:MAG: tectonin domain-containing protein [Chloroflexota bacterium]
MRSIIASRASVLGAVFALTISIVLTPRVTPISAAPLALNAAFEQLPGKALDVAVAPNGQIWKIGADNTLARLDGAAWVTVPFPQFPEFRFPQRLAIGPDNTPWFVSRAGAIPNLKGDNFQEFGGFGAQIRPGEDTKAQDVSIGPSGPWIVQTDGGVKQFDGFADRSLPIEGGARRIAVAPDGTAWVVRPDTKIFARINNAWVEQTGLAKDIGIGANGDIWVVGTDDNLWKRVGTNWDRVDGPAAQIAVGPTGLPVIVSPNGDTFRATSVGGENRPPVAGPPPTAVPVAPAGPRRRASINIQCDFAGSTPSPDWQKDSIQDMFVGTGGLAQYVQEMSYGALTLDGTRTVGRYTMTQSQQQYLQSTDPTQDAFFAATQRLVDDCVGQAAGDIGAIPEPDNALITLFFNAPIGVSGATNVYNVQLQGVTKRYWIIFLTNVGWNSPGLWAHELGHTLGSDDMETFWDPMGRAPLGWGGGSQQDPRRGMLPGYSTYTRDRAGWIPADRKVEYGLNGQQDVQLARLTQPGPQGILMARTSVLPDRSMYTVEYRVPVGFDAAMPLPNGAGAVIIHRTTLHIPGARVPMMAVRANPSDAPDSDGVRWTTGKVYNDPANNISIRIGAMDANQATVTFGPAVL